MLYLGRKPIYSIGRSSVSGGSYYSRYKGSLYVKDACLVAQYYSVTSTNADASMDRVFDWLCYDGGGMRENPPAGGFEVEATFIPTRSDGWCTLWGTRNGTSGKVTRANILIDSSHRISQGISFDPSDNTNYDNSILNKKVHVRLIVLPIASTTYQHAYSGRLILDDVETGQVLTDRTEVWGDNWGIGKNAMFSTVTTFYRFHSGWFSRNRYANPAQNASTGADFEGYFFGGAVYLNPTGADSNYPTRTPVQILTPCASGQVVRSQLNPSYTRTALSDGVMVEILDWSAWLYNQDHPAFLYEMKMMTNCENYTTAVLKYNK